MTYRNRRFLLCALSALLTLITACAGYPTNPAKEAAFHVSKAQEAAQRGDRDILLQQVLLAVDRPSGSDQIRSMLASSPTIKTQLLQVLNTRASGFVHPSAAVEVSKTVARLTTAGALSDSDATQIARELEGRVVALHRSGTVPFAFADAPSTFAALQSADNEALTFQHTLASLSQPDATSRRENLQGVLLYLDRQPQGSPARDRVRSLLPNLNIRRDELPLVATLDSEFVNRRQQQMTLEVSLSIKGADRLFADDLATALLARARGVKVVPAGASPKLRITVERIRHEERRDPERAETVTYKQHEVDTLHAVMLMPRNASYIFEIVSGAAELSYGYAVSSVVGHSQPVEKIVRGKVGGPHSRCQNQRIQNVFGGTSAAGFVANDDMRRQCAGLPEQSMDDLNNQVLNKIVESILEIPAVQSVDEANR